MYVFAYTGCSINIVVNIFLNSASDLLVTELTPSGQRVKRPARRTHRGKCRVM